MRGLGVSVLLEATSPCSLRTRHKARERAADQHGKAARPAPASSGRDQREFKGSAETVKELKHHIHACTSAANITPYVRFAS